MKIKNAFTLVEILLTLSLMGLVMAISIPTLTGNSSNSSQVAGLRKVYSLLDSATFQIMTNNAGTLGHAFTSSSNARAKFANILDISRTCAAGAVSGGTYNCWASSSKLSGGATAESFNPNTNYLGAVLSDGSFLLFYISNTACNGDGVTLQNLCGKVVADINGANGPNTFGRDQFMFLLGLEGLYPGGAPNTLFSLNDDVNNCNVLSTTKDGYGCTYKVLTEGAINY